ncbi:unnamed protein product [Closterium sp. NIES-54]
MHYKGKGGRGGGGGSGGGGGGSSGGGGGSGGGSGSGSGGGSGGFGSGGSGSGGGGGSGGSGSGGGRAGATQCGGSGGGQRQQQQRQSETPSPQQLREWFSLRGASWGSGSCPYAELLRSGVAIFDLDHDAILAAMYALSVSAEGYCYLYVPPDPGIEAAALGAIESALPSTARAEALHTFTLDAGLHLPSFSTNLVGTAALQDAMVTTTTPGGQRVSICTCTWTGRHLATFTRRPWSSLYTLATEPPEVAASAQVPPCSCRLLSHQTLLWHHRLDHPSLPCLRGMQSRLLVSGLPWSLPPLPPCLPCVEGRQRAAPHSSSFPPTTAPLQTLHMDVWGPARVSGQGRECYFLLVVDDYTRYTTVFPLRSKGQVPDALIPWIRAVRLQLREWFRDDLPVLHLHSDKGGEFSSDLLREFCRGEGILQSFTLPDSPRQNGITERRIGLVMEVARTSMIHAAAPHFLWPFAVDPLPGTVPVEVAVDSGAARGAAFWGAASGGAEPGGAEPGGAESEGAGSGDAEPWGAEPRGAEPGDAESEGAESGGAEPRGTASSGGPAGASPRLSPRPEPLFAQPLRKWFTQCTCLWSGAAGAGDSAAGDTGAAGAGVTAGAGGSGGAAAAGPGGAHTRGTGAAGAGSVGGAGVGDPTKPGAAGAGGARAGGIGAGGAGAGGARAVGAGAGGAGAARAGAVDPGAGGTGVGGTVRPRPYFVPLLQQVLGVPSSPDLTPPLLCLLPDQSQPPLQPASLLPAPSPYTEQRGSLTERREPAPRPASPVRTGRHVPRPCPPLVPVTHAMALRPSSVPLRVPLPPPPESSLPAVPDPESDLTRASSPTVSHLLAIVVTDPSFESTAASTFVTELVDFAASCRLDYASALVAESESASPPSLGGECALGTDVLEDRQEDFECLAAAVPRFASMLLAHDGDPDAPDILTPCSYAEAITDPYSSQWQAAMDAERASWKSRGTYVDAVPPCRPNIVDGMWIFRVKQLPGSPTAFQGRYVAIGFTFLQFSLHEVIWLRRPPGFTGSFPAGTQWSLRRLVYGLRQAPHEWHDRLRTTFAALGFTPSTADPSLFLRTNTSPPPFYVFVYIDDLVFATADTEVLTLVKLELQKRHACTDLGELRIYLGLQINRDRARRTITLTQSHMVHQVLQRFSFQFSSPQPTPLSTGHSLSAPPSDEFVEPSGLSLF